MHSSPCILVNLKDHPFDDCLVDQIEIYIAQNSKEVIPI